MPNECRSASGSFPRIHTWEITERPGREREEEGDGEEVGANKWSAESGLGCGFANWAKVDVEFCKREKFSLS